ncbi:hypothetical protein LOTGIDRAFT_235119 [Lottia gigantea]|uniref:TIR domain-containing protein n=1 Tax=Lottia gigantea TaxID=225164 RepID=V4BF27_LOTGI|nr:hypothetical protein LOTGIDRAFT_235119 [Lottia gigantea]ESO87459.1 hypothetical protein LOTGIDRAFT_235119 [Lottia gigantea]
MAGRNPKYNTWSHRGRRDTFETNFHIGEDDQTSNSSTHNSLDEASTLNPRYRNNSRSDSLTENSEDGDGETPEDEGNLEDITLKTENDIEITNEINETVVTDNSIEGISVSDILVNLKSDGGDKVFEIVVGGARSVSSSPNPVETNKVVLRDKRGHKLHLTRPESNFTPTLNKTKKKVKRFRSTGGSIYQKDREKDVFLLYFSDGKATAMDLSFAFKRHSIEWCEYEKDFNPSHSILYDLSVFLFTCKRIVAVLSPGFYQSNLFMYFLQTTVKYCVDHGKNALIPILVDTTPSDIPLWLNSFRYFQCVHPNWTEDVCEVLAEKVQPLKCKDHVWNEHFNTISSTTSEPLNPKKKLSKRTEREMKIWLQTKFGSLPQEFQNERSNAGENEEIEKTENVSAKRGVNSEIMFANQLRQENKKVYDSADTFIEEGFDVAVGDILEICETCEDGKYVRVRNSRGQTTSMPKQNVLPNVFLLPKAAVEMLQFPALKAENDAFERELRSIGMKVFTTVHSAPLNSRYKFQKNDIFAKIYVKGKYANVKNCRNEILFVENRFLKEKDFKQN